jgi:hypothetical protein
VYCQRRGKSCISQEFPDPANRPKAVVGVEERLHQMESLVNQIIKQKKAQDSADSAMELGLSVVNGNRKRTPRKLMAPSTHMRTTWTGITTPNNVLNTSQTLSNRLFAEFPHPLKVALIVTAGKYSAVPIHLRGQSGKAMTSVGCLYSCIDELPVPTSHPLLFAKKFIQLALILQQTDVETSKELGSQLKEHVLDISQKYLDLAAQHVTLHDSLLESPDGLETLILQGVYYLNVGNLRAAWLVFRRGLTIAQLLELSHKIGEIGDRMHVIWFQLVYSNLFVSLMLGLPCDIPESAFLLGQNETDIGPVARLERTYAMFMGRVIKRNIRMKHRYPPDNTQHGDYDYGKETRDISVELSQANQQLPQSWWSMPTLETTDSEVEGRQKTTRLIVQMDRYLILLFLYQPYLLIRVQTSPKVDDPIFTSPPFDDGYCQGAVLAASREVISRYAVLRGSHQGLKYRIFDDKVFQACTMLLLVHVVGHRLGGANVLEYQRQQDLELVKNTIYNIQKAISSVGVATSSSNLLVLKKLLKIESDASKGIKHSIRIQNSHDEDDDPSLENESLVAWNVPYFGTVLITCQSSSDQDPLATLDTELSEKTYVFNESHGSEIAFSIGTTVDHEASSQHVGLEYDLLNSEDQSRNWLTLDGLIDEPVEDLYPWSVQNLKGTFDDWL